MKKIREMLLTTAIAVTMVSSPLSTFAATAAAADTNDYVKTAASSALKGAHKALSKHTKKDFRGTKASSKCKVRSCKYTLGQLQKKCPHRGAHYTVVKGKKCSICNISGTLHKSISKHTLKNFSGTKATSKCKTKGCKVKLADLQKRCSKKATHWTIVKGKKCTVCGISGTLHKTLTRHTMVDFGADGKCLDAKCKYTLQSLQKVCPNKANHAEILIGEICEICGTVGIKEDVIVPLPHKPLIEHVLGDFSGMLTSSQCKTEGCGFTLGALQAICEKYGKGHTTLLSGSTCSNCGYKKAYSWDNYYPGGGWGGGSGGGGTTAHTATFEKHTAAGAFYATTAEITEAGEAATGKVVGDCKVKDCNYTKTQFQAECQTNKTLAEGTTCTVCGWYKGVETDASAKPIDTQAATLADGGKPAVNVTGEKTTVTFSDQKTTEFAKALSDAKDADQGETKKVLNVTVNTKTEESTTAVKALEVALPQEVIAEMAKVATDKDDPRKVAVTVDSNVGKIMLPYEALKGATGDVTLEVKPVAGATKEKFQLGENDVAVEVNLKDGNTVKKVEGLEKTNAIQITLPKPTGIAPNTDVNVYYVSGDKLVSVGTTKATDTGIAFQTTHLTEFVIQVAKFSHKAGMTAAEHDKTYFTEESCKAEGCIVTRTAMQKACLGAETGPDGAKVKLAHDQIISTGKCDRCGADGTHTAVQDAHTKASFVTGEGQDAGKCKVTGCGYTLAAFQGACDKYGVGHTGLKLDVECDNCGGKGAHKAEAASHTWESFGKATPEELAKLTAADVTCTIKDCGFKLSELQAGCSKKGTGEGVDHDDLVTGQYCDVCGKAGSAGHSASVIHVLKDFQVTEEDKTVTKDTCQQTDVKTNTTCTATLADFQKKCGGEGNTTHKFGTTSTGVCTECAWVCDQHTTKGAFTGTDGAVKPCGTCGITQAAYHAQHAGDTTWGSTAGTCDKCGIAHTEHTYKQATTGENPVAATGKCETCGLDHETGTTKHDWKNGECETCYFKCTVDHKAMQTDTCATCGEAKVTEGTGGGQGGATHDSVAPAAHELSDFEGGTATNGDTTCTKCTVTMAEWHVANKHTMGDTSCGTSGCTVTAAAAEAKCTTHTAHDANNADAGKCTICKKQLNHTWPTSTNTTGKCTGCDYTHPHTDWDTEFTAGTEEAKECGTCHLTLAQFRTDCQTHAANAAKTWGADTNAGICSNCGYECPHKAQAGEDLNWGNNAEHQCATCGFVCTETDHTGACETCGKKAE